MAGAYPSSRRMKQLRVSLQSITGLPPQQWVSVSHLYTWVERDNVGQSILSKETTQWQGLGFEPPTFRSEVQSTNHWEGGGVRDGGKMNIFWPLTLA